MAKKTAQRQINVDIIRIVAMSLVVFMHTAYNFTLRTDFFATKLWFILEPLAAVSKTCVLLFFMVSGYLVINKKRTIQENWTRIKQRILVPLIFFESVNILYSAYLYHFDTQSFQEFVSGQVTRLTSHPNSPLWFLVVLFYLYVLNPVWYALFSKENKQIASYTTKGGFVFSAILMLGAFMSQRVDSIFNLFTSWVGYACFYLYGGMVANGWLDYRDKTKNNWLIFVGFFGTIIGDYVTLWSKVENKGFLFTDYTGNFLSIPVMMLSVGVFNYLLSQKWEQLSTKAENKVIALANISYGIYLIHTFVVSFLTDIVSFNFDQISMNVYLYIMTNFALVLGISVILSSLITRTPFIKKLVGEK